MKGSKKAISERKNSVEETLYYLLCISTKQLPNGDVLIPGKHPRYIISTACEHLDLKISFKNEYSPTPNIKGEFSYARDVVVKSDSAPLLTKIINGDYKDGRSKKTPQQKEDIRPVEQEEQSTPTFELSKKLSLKLQGETFRKISFRDNGSAAPYYTSYGKAYTKEEAAELNSIINKIGKVSKPQAGNINVYGSSVIEFLVKHFGCKIENVKPKITQIDVIPAIQQSNSVSI